MGFLLLAQGSLTATASGPPRITAPVQATKGDVNPGRTYSSPSLAVDPGNPMHVVAAYAELRTRRCGLLRSIDGGQSWKRLDASPSLDSYPFCTAPSSAGQGVIAFGRHSTLYYAFVGWDTQDRLPGNGGNLSIFVARSSDLGDSWKTTAVRDARGLQGEDMEGNRPLSAMAVDTHSGNDDIVYVTFRREFRNKLSPNAAPRVPVVSVSRDGARTFDTPMNLAQGVFDSEAVRSDALKTVTTPTTLGPPGSRSGQPNQAANFGGGIPTVTVDGKGTAYAVWPSNYANLSDTIASALFLSKSTDHGKTWTSSAITPFDAKNLGAFNSPRLVWSAQGGPKGTLHLVQEHTNRPELSTQSDLGYWRSTDGGTSWSGPETLNDDGATNLAFHGISNMGVAPNGRIDVVWWDTRNDPGIRANDVYYTASTDNGLTWSKNARITDRIVDRTFGVWGNNFDMTAPPGLASTNALAVMGWDDTRNSPPDASGSIFTGGWGGGVQDIYASAVQYRVISTGASPGVKAALAGVVGMLAVGLVMLLAAYGARRRTGPAPARETIGRRSGAGVS